MLPKTCLVQIEIHELLTIYLGQNCQIRYHQTIIKVINNKVMIEGRKIIKQ